MCSICWVLACEPANGTAMQNTGRCPVYHRLVDSTQCPCCPSDDTLVLAAIKPVVHGVGFGMMGEQGVHGINTCQVQHNVCYNS